MPTKDPELSGLKTNLTVDACCGIVELIGELDVATTDTFRMAAAEAQHAKSVGHVIVDCRYLEFIDSSGLKAVLDAYYGFSGDLVLWRPTRAVLRVLELAALDQTLTVAASLDAARHTLHTR